MDEQKWLQNFYQQQNFIMGNNESTLQAIAAAAAVAVDIVGSIVYVMYKLHNL